MAPRPRQNRQSCDRCHAHKLRCPKQFGNAICTRCSKAGAACVYSPVGTLPISQDLPVVLDTLPLSDETTNLDWEAFSFDHLVGFPGPRQPDRVPSLDKATLPRYTVDPRTRCLQDLSTIMASLDEAMKSLPPVSEFHVPGPQFKEYCLEISKTYSHKQSIELMLSQTQKLIDIYPNTIALAIKQHSTPDCSISDCMHTYRSHIGLNSDPFVAAAQLASKIDYPLLNLLLCCHYRCADVMEIVFCHAQVCFEFLTVATQQGVQPHQFVVPELRVGSFTPSPRSSPSIITAILVDLQSLLACCIPKLSTSLNEHKENLSKEGRILLLKCELLIERADSIVERLKQLKVAVADAELFSSSLEINNAPPDLKTAGC
ncbi:hypothetical protein EsH8_VII_000253 [Colletotrichum jinshuiense]